MHLLLALSLTIAYPFNEQTIARKDVQACFGHLFSTAYFGRANYERAAFLVLEPDGSIGCRDWPPTFSFKAALDGEGTRRNRCHRAHASSSHPAAFAQ